VEKIAQGVTLEPRVVLGEDEKAKEMHRLQNKRDASRGTAVLGVGLMFAASWSANLAVGGAIMLVWGFAGSFYFSRKMKALDEDPWDDAEIDAWEKENY